MSANQSLPTSQAQMTAEAEKLCSERAIYSILNKGQRLTRNTIRKEQGAYGGPKPQDQVKSVKRQASSGFGQPSSDEHQGKRLKKQRSKMIQDLDEAPPMDKAQEEKPRESEAKLPTSSTQQAQPSQKGGNHPSGPPTAGGPGGTPPTNPNAPQKGRTPNSQPPAKPPKKPLVDYVSLRHSKMIEKFEQHLPHFEYAKNRLALYGEGLTPIKSFTPQKTASAELQYFKDQLQTQSLNPVQAAQLQPVDFSSLVANLAYGEGETIPIIYNRLKVISRVYLCSNKFISEIPEEISECMVGNPEGDSKILVVQAIGENSGDKRAEEGSLKFSPSSHRPMSFYALGRNDEEELILEEVTFNNALTELEIAEEMSQDKYSDQHFVSKKATHFDPLRDLEDYKLKEPLEEQSPLRKQFAYSEDQLGPILEEAFKINQVFDTYHASVNKVQVTAANLYHCLFTLCHWKHTTRGILVQIHYQASTDNYWLLLRLINMSTNQLQKMKWVPLKLYNQEKQCYEDTTHSLVYKGYSSLPYLAQLDNTYQTGVKLRSKHIQFISHCQLHMSARRQINSLIFADSKLLSLAQKALLDPHPTRSPSVMSQSEGGPHLNFFRNRNGDACADCGKEAKRRGFLEKQLRCDDCQRCTECKSKVGNNMHMLFCSDCGGAFHFDCLSESYLQKLPNPIQELASRFKANGMKPLVGSMKQFKFKCSVCVSCLDCNKADSSGQWDEEFSRCHDCAKPVKIALDTAPPKVTIPTTKPSMKKDLIEDSPSPKQAKKAAPVPVPAKVPFHPVKQSVPKPTITADIAMKNEEKKQEDVPIGAQSPKRAPKQQRELYLPEAKQRLNQSQQVKKEPSSALGVKKTFTHFQKGHEIEIQNSASPERPRGQQLDSPEMFRRIEQNDMSAPCEEVKSFKKQKIVDPYEQTSHNIQTLLEHPRKENYSAAPERVSLFEGSKHRPRQAEQQSVASGRGSFGTVSCQVYSATPSNWHGHNDKNKKKMIEQYQQEDDEKCYYVNPIRCSFDNPLLVFEEMCYLCGAFGNQEDFVSCKLCSESYHTYCLDLPSNDIEGVYQQTWKCLNCKSCEVCGKATDEDQLNFCEYCERPFHSYCLSPEIKHIPEKWRCEFCFRCKVCDTNKFYSEQNVKDQLNLTNEDYSLSKNYTQCFDCSQNSFKMQFCSICDEKTTKEMHRRLETMKCQQCGCYSHLECSRVTLQQLESIMVQVNSKKTSKGGKIMTPEEIYYCLDCLVSQKTIVALVYEACQEYENIQNMISRHQLLSQICLEILQSYFPEQFKNRAQIFIQKFIFQNQAFFKFDPLLNKWLSLMETEVYLYPGQSKVEQEVILPKEDKSLYGHWKKGYNPFEASKFVDSSVLDEQFLKSQPIATFHNQAISEQDSQATKFTEAETELTAHKRSFLPEKRELYTSLYKGDVNMFDLGGKRTEKVPYPQNSLLPPRADEDLFMRADEMKEALYETQEKKETLVNRLVNGLADDEELSSEYSESNEDYDGGKTLVQQYVEKELASVFRIQMQFVKWFEKYYKKTMHTFQGKVKPEPAPSQQILAGGIEPFDSEEESVCSRNGDSSDSEVACGEDLEVINPQQHLTCLLCKQKGEFTVTGRLIPYKMNMYVHVSCALWTEEVFDIEEGQIINFYDQEQKLINQKCSLCGELGATLTCKKKNCNRHFHFPCAFRSGKMRFTKPKEMFCDVCCKSRPGPNGGALGTLTAQNQLQNKAFQAQPELVVEVQQAFPGEYLKKKRMYIVKNMEEITQQEYLEKYEGVREDQSDTKKKREKDKKDQKGRRKSEVTLKEQQQVNEEESECSSAPKLPVDKWRPFYFDLFNRVGNLTILSLRKDVNQLIDVINHESQATGKAFLASYLNQKRVDGDFEDFTQGLNQSPDQRQSGEQMMEDLRANLDIFSDYASIRIYWKTYDDKKLTLHNSECHDPRKMKKAYFLFVNKTKKIYELDKGDLNSVLEFCSQQIKDSVQVQSHTPEGTKLKAQVDPQAALPQDYFWQKISGHFIRLNSNFCLQNIEFSVEKLFGFAKYPINVWNQLELRSSDVRTLNGTKSKMEFFLKSAQAILRSANYAGAAYGKYSLSGQNQNAIISAKEKSIREQINLNNILMGKVLSMDGVFQRMIKVNNMDKFDYDRLIDANPSGFVTSSSLPSAQLGVRGLNRNNVKLNQMDQPSVNQISSKHMTYRDILTALGKTRKVIIEKILTEKKLSPAEKEKEGPDLFEKQQQSRSRKKQLNEIKNQFQSVQQQRENQVLAQIESQQNSSNQKEYKRDLPLAMLYRQSTLQPKKLEVGQSKIHRIGLFTLEDLKKDDILIEYVGEIINNRVSDHREKRYKDKGIGDCYMFRLADDLVIDATFFGGKARYLNHSCDANCYAEQLTVNNQQHIIIRAKKNIVSGEELTYNYQFGEDEDKLQCFCGAKNCNGDF